MNYIISICTFLFISLSVDAQFRYHFETFPSDATVKMNDKAVCQTPCEVDFYWRDAVNDEITFSVEKDGFYAWGDTISMKPRTFDFYYDEDLKRRLPVLDFDTITPLILFDKLVVNFKDGQKVGSYKDELGETINLNWEGSTKIGTKKVESLFYEIGNNAGLNTPIYENAKLFGDTKPTPTARFIVGVEITDYKVGIEQSKGRNSKLSTALKISFNWQIKDLFNDEIVVNYNNIGQSSSVKSYSDFNQDNLLAIEDAIVDFISSKELYDVVENAKSLKKPKRVSHKNKIIIDSISSKEFDSFSAMVKYANKSCVTIKSDRGHGSGFIIDKNGMIITSNHVIEGANQIQVHFSNGIELDAEIIFTDKNYDVALLKIPGSGYQPLKLNNFPVELGEEISTIGTPANLELGQSISKGVISGKRLIDEQLYHQLNMSVSPGNSGGPLLNGNGDVIGIVFAKVTGEGVEGIAFAVPTSKLIESLNISY